MPKMLFLFYEFLFPNPSILCPNIPVGKTVRLFWVMDVNGDGAIQAKDALEILKYSVMKIDGFARQPVLYTPVTNTDVTNTNQSN